jgi:hypothetical protein
MSTERPNRHIEGQEGDEALMALLEESGGPVSVSAVDGRARTVEERVAALHGQGGETRSGSCYSHSSWGN